MDVPGGSSVHLGAQITMYRRRAGLSQRDLADRAGISLSAVRDLEQGRTVRPRGRSVRALASALGLTDADTAVLYSSTAVDGEPGAPTDPDGPLRIGILGPLSIYRGPVEVTLGAGRRRTMLARLALGANTTVPMHDLIDVLWAEQPPASPAAVVHAHISRLRRSLDPARSGRARDSILGISQGGYQLRLGDGQLDAATFRRLVRDAAIAAQPSQALGLLDEALRLWRHDPVSDIAELRHHPAATALAQERIDAVLRYADLAGTVGTGERALPCLRDLAARYHLHEPLHAALITALAGTGRQAEALTAYDTIRRRLADDLGINPGEQLTVLHQRILHEKLTPPPQTPRPHPAGPAQLPPDVTGFVGRVAELRQMDALLTTAGEETTAVVITAVSGTAGVGKTALAVHWAHQVRHRFPDGQMYVNLRGFDPSGAVMTPAEAVRGFLDALGVVAQRVPTGLDAQVALYRTLLADRRMLVVLDNARDAKQVRPLLPGAPGCLAVVTSRNQLTSLIAAEGARPLALDLLSDAEARDLLHRRLGTDRAAAEPEATADIVAACARLPLALAIAAARAVIRPNLPLAALADELREASGRLDIFTDGDPATDVRSVFSWSYEALSPGAARLFRLLGLHPGPDTAAPAVASLAGISIDEVRPLLTELTRTHLLFEYTPGRYTFHDLLRAYATEQAATHDSCTDRREALHRMLDHYMHAAHQAAMLEEPHREETTPASATAGVTVENISDRVHATSWFMVEHRVLLTAIQHAANAGLAAHAEHLTWSLWKFLDRRGQWRDLIEAERASLKCAQRTADKPSQARAHYGLAVAYTRFGRYDDAHTHQRQSLRLYEELRDYDGQAHVHLNMSAMLNYLGDHRPADSHARQSLALYRAAGNRRGEARALGLSGSTRANLGDGPGAVSHCRQALTMHQELGDRYSEGQAWKWLGEVHLELVDDYQQAITCFHNALGVFREFGDRYSEAGTLAKLGDTQRLTGHLDATLDAYREALAILDEVEHPDADKIRRKLRDLTSG